MAVQAVLMDEVGTVRRLRYICSEDGSLFLALDCLAADDSEVMTFTSLCQELKALCWWQLRERVMIGLPHAVADVLTLYHAFEHSKDTKDTLMLVSTPPDEYFDSLAA